MSGDSVQTILCFGDSLTAGYQSPTHEVPYYHETPYGGFLQKRLGPRIKVITSGICGEVTSDMVQRFQQDVVLRSPDYIVILGGTNDLGWQDDPAEIFSRLRTLYTHAREARIRPVAVTVPSIRMDIDPASRAWLQEVVMQRRKLNEMIAAHCAQEEIPWVDLFTATADPDTLLLAERYSNDGLHLTTEGYRTMADLLYEQVFRARVPERHS